MSPNDPTWNRIDDAFQRALEIDTDREDWVRREFSGDPAIRDEVLALLADAARSEQAIDSLFASRERLINTAVDRHPLPERGLIEQRIGNFVVTELIARGGMGVVYKAERADDQWQQTVAIKILPSWAGDPNSIARLEAERQILSRLKHPNIPPILDGGTTNDGYPYFVTEFIEGVSITDYVEENALSISARLDLFRAVCDAVHYAHTKLVIHRDIKPSNILVDKEGRPHLLDFGIAKPLDASGDATAELTLQGFTPMTLRNASPEQLAGDSVSTASDVYQLGLLLHRLLTGDYPAIDNGSTLTTVYKAQDGSETKRSKGPESLRGDLGTIASKALRSNPAERYASAAALAADVQAYLRGRAIAAKPESTIEIIRRLARRNPAGAALVVMLVLLVFGWFASLQLHSKELKAERDFAQKQAVRAERVKDVLTDIYRRQDPLLADPARERPETMIESLNIAVDTARDELRAEPDIMAELFSLFSALYAGAGREDLAMEMLEESIRLLQQSEMRDTAQLAETQSQLANLLQNTDREQSEFYYEAALELVPSIVETAPASAVHVLLDAAVGAHNSGQRDKALEIYRRAMSIYSDASLDDPSMRIELLFGTGVSLIQQDQLSAAEPLLLEALRVSASAFGPEHARIAGVLDALSSLERNRANLDAAITYSNRAVAILERDRSDNYNSLLSARNDLALALGKARRFDESIAILKSVVETHRSLNPNTGSVGLATSSKNLATILHMAGYYDEAMPYAMEAKRLMQMHLPQDSAYQATPHFTMALIQLDSGRPREAEISARRSLEILLPALGNSHYQVHVNRCVIGESLIRQGEIVAGLAIAEPALSALLAAETRVARYEQRCKESVTQARTAG